MNKYHVIIIVVALLSYALGRHLGEEIVRPQLMLVEQQLQAYEVDQDFANYVMHECTTQYTELTGLPFRVSVQGATQFWLEKEDHSFMVFKFFKDAKFRPEKDSDLGEKNLQGSEAWKGLQI